MKNIGKIFLLAVLFTLATSDNLYNLVLHSQQRGAACLDGSPAGLYIHEGSAQNKNKFMIYFDSGGFCGGFTLSDTLQSCYKRSSSSLGTTKNYKPQKSFDGQGLLSSRQEDNPLFFDWTKIFVIYCDGSEHQGHRQNPIPYKDKNLYFRGTKNTLEQFRYLDEHYDFYNGEMIIMTGVSAGGMATFQWSNYLLDNTKTSKVFAIPDSGFFIIDFYTQIQQMKVLKLYAKNLIDLVGIQQQYLPEPIKKCIQKPGLQLVDCYNSANYAQFLRAPMFIVESPIDAYSLQNIVAVKCLNGQKPPFNLQSCTDQQMNAIEQYRKMSLQQIQQFKTRKNVGIWGPACAQHGFTDDPTFTNPNFKVNGLMVSEAIARFLKDPDNAEWNLDDEPWPSNKGCSGIIKGYSLKRKWYLNE